MGLEAKHTIFDVLTCKKDIHDVILNGPYGVKVIPASSGIFQMTQLSFAERTTLMERLESSSFSFDILLIDTGAGINSDVAYLNAAATEVLVVVTPEPTSIADAYAVMKVMSQEHGVKRFKLLVNFVGSSREALGVYNNLLTVSDRFLNIQIEYLGYVLKDSNMGQAVLARKVLCEGWPDSPAVLSLKEVVKTLLALPAKTEITGNIQFFWKSLLNQDEVGI
jgi:flagellar biosynthesis protein FlhG